MALSRQVRHIIKAVTYRVMSVCITFIILKLFGMSTSASIVMTAALESISTIMYFIFEEAWDTIKHKLHLVHPKKKKPRPRRV